MITQASQFQLGVMYCTGQGVSLDLSKAIAWYELAAQLGYPLAQYNLAVMLAKGQGCKPDRDKGAFVVQRAAEQGWRLRKRRSGIRWSRAVN